MLRRQPRALCRERHGREQKTGSSKSTSFALSSRNLALVSDQDALTRRADKPDEIQTSANPHHAAAAAPPRCVPSASSGFFSPSGGRDSARKASSSERGM